MTRAVLNHCGRGKSEGIDVPGGDDAYDATYSSDPREKSNLADIKNTNTPGALCGGTTIHEIPCEDWCTYKVAAAVGAVDRITNHEECEDTRLSSMESTGGILE